MLRNTMNGNQAAGKESFTAHKLATGIGSALSGVSYV